jgi:hypothetical protein
MSARKPSPVSKNEIKEYNIAVEALGRPADFEPSKDSIVRVEAHRLRSRLERYYRQNPSHCKIRIQIPSGSYIPQFLREEVNNAIPGGENEFEIGPLGATTTHVSSDSLMQSLDPQEIIIAARSKTRTTWVVAFIGLALIVVVVVLATIFVRHQAARSSVIMATSAANPPLDGVRILSGVASSTFIDAHGIAWMGDRYFIGGEAESITPRTIAFADDSSLFTKRRRGTFGYKIPLVPGTYELRLYFADAFFGEGNPDGGGESSRLFDVNANGKNLLQNFDVILDAGGSNTADVKIFKDIQPDKDGFLHLNFIPKRDVAFINAIEVIRSVPHKTLPIRITMSKIGYSDQKGDYWESDRYFRGGVNLSNGTATISGSSPSPRIGERFGNFTYAIPVASTGHYSVTLTFKNRRITQTPGNASEAGPNIFNVYVNGQTVLDHFVIPASGNPSDVISKTFENLQPNAQGKLIFSFVPVRNYAVVSSIEVLDQNF